MTDDRLDYAVRVVDEWDRQEFEQKCQELLDQGYVISSTYCGFIPLEAPNFCNSYQAIFVRPWAAVGSLTPIPREGAPRSCAPPAPPADRAIARVDWGPVDGGDFSESTGGQP